MRFWRFLFVALISLAALYAVQLGGKFSIDTGLADVAPKLASSPQAKEALAALRQNIEKRMILLVSGHDEDVVLDATDQLVDRLTSDPDIAAQLQVLPTGDELIEKVIRAITPYRFALLSEDQKRQLIETPPEQLSRKAQQDAYSISSARLFPFDKDPFGVSSESLLQSLQALAPSSENQQDDVFYQTVPLLIKGDALSMNQQNELLAGLNRATGESVDQYDVQVDRSGVFFFAAHAAQQSKRDISLISSVSTLGVVLLLLFVFRSATALLLPVFSIAVGVGFAFIATHAVFGSVHVLTIVFGASLVGIVIDYSLHYFYHSATFIGAVDASGTEALNTSHEQGEHQALHRALLLSLCTSLIGYAALSFSGLDALKKVALFSCCGLLMAWLCVVVLGARMVTGRLVIKAERLSGAVGVIQFGVRRLTPKTAGLLVGLILVAAIGSWFAFKPVNDDPRVFFTAPQALLDSERKVASVANDFEPGRYVLIQSDSLQGLQSRFQATMMALEARTDLPASALSSLLQFVPPADEQQASYQQQAKLYRVGGALDLLAHALNISPEAVAAIRRDYEKAEGLTLAPNALQAVLGDALPPMWFQDQDNYLGFVLVRKGSDTQQLANALTQVNGVEYVNTLAETQTALFEQRQSAAWLLGLAYLLVAGLLIARFKRLWAASMLLVPLSSSAALVLLATPLGYQLNLFHIMALFLVLGFGMDYAIFVREMSAHQAKTLQAILLSAITSLLSFGLLSVSSIPVVAAFGTALLIGNAFNLLGAFAFSAVHKTY